MAVKVPKTIITDVDGVLLDWEGMFTKWMTSHSQGSPQVDNEYSQAIRYGLSKIQADLYVKTFNESAHIRYMKPLPHTERMIEKFRTQGWNFKCVTSLSTDKFAVKAREDNLTDLYQNSMIEVQCLETGADKTKALEELSKKHPGAWWIEDKPENALVGLQFGFRTILMTHTYNKDFECPEGMIRCKDFLEVFDAITVFKRL
tara:strand:+ start:149 stop:754 length:606 start_codon:yes stop_codon:yes gene_type:complete